jgi:hypothetical protein
MEMLRRIGLEPVIEGFTSARSCWHPYVLFYGLVLVSEVFFWTGGFWGTIAALVLAWGAFVSVLLEMAFYPNPIRWLLPKGRSQNAYGRIRARDSTQDQLVLLGHLDTHRTPLVFSTETWVRLFRVLVPIGIVCFLALVTLFAADIIASAHFWRLLSLPFALFMLAQFLITLQADFSPHTSGANDNATGAGVVLRLAERLKERPLAHTDVWAVLSGCEEVGCYGADVFARRHRDELKRAAWVTVDNVGGVGANPTYLNRETFLLTTHSDPELLALADRVASNHPTLKAQADTFRGAFTEGAIGGKHGMRVLTVLAFRPDGALPDWHRPTDLVENVAPDVVERVETFLWEFLQHGDRQIEQGIRGSKKG